MGNNNSVKRIVAALGGVCFFVFFHQRDGEKDDVKMVKKTKYVV